MSNQMQVKIITAETSFDIESEINEELTKIKGSIIDVQVQYFYSQYIATIKYTPEKATRMTLKESK